MHKMEYLHFEFDRFFFFVGGHSHYFFKFDDRLEMHIWTFRSLFSTSFLNKIRNVPR
jgi:hypothetical protein